MVKTISTVYCGTCKASGLRKRLSECRLRKTFRLTTFVFIPLCGDLIWICRARLLTWLCLLPFLFTDHSPSGLQAQPPYADVLHLHLPASFALSLSGSHLPAPFVVLSLIGRRGAGDVVSSRIYRRLRSFLCLLQENQNHHHCLFTAVLKSCGPVSFISPTHGGWKLCPRLGCGSLVSRWVVVSHFALPGHYIFLYNLFLFKPPPPLLYFINGVLQTTVNTINMIFYHP